jgi:hypothetical protein
VFCLKVEYYLENRKQLERSDAANAIAMDQHAESVFDFLDKAEKDKTPMRLTLMGINDTVNFAQMTLAYQEEGINGLLGGKKKEKKTNKRARSLRPWGWMKKFEKAQAAKEAPLIE